MVVSRVGDIPRTAFNVGRRTWRPLDWGDQRLRFQKRQRVKMARVHVLNARAKEKGYGEFIKIKQRQWGNKGIKQGNKERQGTEKQRAKSL